MALFSMKFRVGFYDKRGFRSIYGLIAVLLALGLSVIFGDVLIINKGSGDMNKNVKIINKTQDINKIDPNNT